MPFSKNIIGKGFIAKNLYKISNVIEKSDYIIYAAGISNSKIKSLNKLKKEINLFKKFITKNQNSKIVYISTADVTNNLKNKSKYVLNKIKIEKLIQKYFEKYIIIRLPQIIGKSKNKNTLINFFNDKIKKEKEIELLNNIKRNLLDISDVIKMIKTILINKRIKRKIIILSNKYSLKPIEIVQILELKHNKKAKYNIKKTNKQIWNLNFNKNLKYFKKAKIKFNKDYFIKSINKYY